MLGRWRQLFNLGWSSDKTQNHHCKVYSLEEVTIFQKLLRGYSVLNAQQRYAPGTLHPVHTPKTLKTVRREEEEENDDNEEEAEVRCEFRGRVCKWPPSRFLPPPDLAITANHHMVEKVEALRFSERRLRVTTPRSAPGSFAAGGRGEIGGLYTRPDRRRKEAQLWRMM